MKKIYFLISFVFAVTVAGAQMLQPQPPNEEKLQQIEALKVAFISRELQLTPQEAQRFWPVYYQYSMERKSIARDNTNVLQHDEQVLNLKKRYNIQFTQVLGPQRANQFFGAEARFHEVLIRAIRERQDQYIQPDRPYMRHHGMMRPYRSY